MPTAHPIENVRTGADNTPPSNDNYLSASIWSEMSSLLQRDTDTKGQQDGITVAGSARDGLVALSDYPMPQLTIDDGTRATGARACQPETEQVETVVAGQPTVVNKLTEFGEWLRAEAGVALNIDPPSDKPQLTQQQQDMLDAAGPHAQQLAEKLLAMSQGQVDPTMRDDIKALQKLFTQRGVPPEEAREFYKAVCDAINQQLAASGKDWMRIAISETTGEVYVGIKSQLDGKFKPTFELRSQVDCPEMPK